MNIVLGSIFRNSTRYLHDYFGRVSVLALELEARGHVLRLALAEADSTDATAFELRDYHIRLKSGAELLIDVVNRTNGSPWYGSVDLDDRWRAISYVCNGVLEQVRNDDDILIYVESDLIWKPDALLQLVERVQEPGVDACAAMCFHRGSDVFYDVWGHRKDGVKFGPQAPYHPGVNGALTEIDSAGSCIVMRGIVARNARFTPPELGIVGFCGDIRGRGFKLWLDPTVKVEHP